MNPIGQRMKLLREENRLSQAEVAKLCESNQTTIAKMESGRTAPSAKVLVCLADYYDISLDYLCCRTDQPQGKRYTCVSKAAAEREEMRKFIEMCFDPKSAYHDQLKETMLKMMEESRK